MGRKDREAGLIDDRNEKGRVRGMGSGARSGVKRGRHQAAERAGTPSPWRAWSPTYVVLLFRQAETPVSQAGRRTMARARPSTRWPPLTANRSMATWLSGSFSVTVADTVITAPAPSSGTTTGRVNRTP